MMTYPAYLQLYKSGELFARIEKSKALPENTLKSTGASVLMSLKMP
ncbi:MAG: hypothetical protein AAB422_00825 [Planctomycetota bacterium]